MRTTLDLPDSLFKKAKLQAVHEGVALKEVVTRALERGLAANSGAEDNARQSRAKRLFASLDKARNTKPVGPLHRAKLYDRSVLRGH